MVLCLIHDNVSNKTKLTMNDTCRETDMCKKSEIQEKINRTLVI